MENQRWRDEHRRFASSLIALQQAAETVPELSQPEVRKRIDEVHAFLRERFLPHARAEEDALYPVGQRTLDARIATELMVRDHDEVVRLSRKLEALRERLVYSYFGQAQLRSLQEVLYDLHAIIQLHIAKEDEIYLPAMDKSALTPAVPAP